MFSKTAFPIFATNYLKAFEREGSMQSINKADSSQGYHILANIKQHLYQSWSPNFRDDHYHHVPQYFFRSFFVKKDFVMHLSEWRKTVGSCKVYGEYKISARIL